MKINKQEALVLSKMVHPHVAFTVQDSSEFQVVLRELSQRLDHFLTCDDDHQCDEKDDDYDIRPDDDDSEEITDEDQNVDELDDDIHVEEELKFDSIVHSDELHALPLAKCSLGKIEFEDVSDDDHHDRIVDILLDGYTEVKGVTHLKRKSKELHVRDEDGKWTIFHVSKFPSKWVGTLPLNDLIEVIPA